jgi:hypothetical protein
MNSVLKLVLVVGGLAALAFGLKQELPAIQRYIKIERM